MSVILFLSANAKYVIQDEGMIVQIWLFYNLEMLAWFDQYQVRSNNNQ